MPTPPVDLLGDASEFESHRRHLRALAYRMLGSRADAEDVVQECWLRWQAVDQSAVQNARAYLSQTATHLCLDHLQSARMQREQYVGIWLPEPLVDESGDFSPGPEVVTEYAQEVGIAFMLALERLSALERAAFVLHDVFDLAFDEVAQRLGRTSEACRQLAARARSHLKAGKARATVDDTQRDQLLLAFGHALQAGNVDALASLLAQDAQFLSDGGGVVSAVPKLLTGNLRIAQAMIGFARLYDPAELTIRPAWVNGLPGMVMCDRSTVQAIQTMALELDEQDQVAAIYVVRNPEKLGHLHG